MDLKFIAVISKIVQEFSSNFSERRIFPWKFFYNNFTAKFQIVVFSLVVNSEEDFYWCSTKSQKSQKIFVMEFFFKKAPSSRAEEQQLCLELFDRLFCESKWFLSEHDGYFLSLGLVNIRPHWHSSRALIWVQKCSRNYIPIYIIRRSCYWKVYFYIL